MAKREMKTTKPVTEVEEQVVETIPETKEETVDKGPSIVKVIVANCTKLNIRKKPDLKADISKVVNAGAELSILETSLSKDWCELCDKKGKVIGYCMKKYVKVNK